MHCNCYCYYYPPPPLPARLFFAHHKAKQHSAQQAAHLIIICALWLNKYTKQVGTRQHVTQTAVFNDLYYNVCAYLLQYSRYIIWELIGVTNNALK